MIVTKFECVQLCIYDSSKFVEPNHGFIFYQDQQDWNKIRYDNLVLLPLHKQRILLQILIINSCNNKTEWIHIYLSNK